MNIFWGVVGIVYVFLLIITRRELRTGLEESEFYADE